MDEQTTPTYTTVKSSFVCKLVLLTNKKAEEKDAETAVRSLPRKKKRATEKAEGKQKALLFFNGRSLFVYIPSGAKDAFCPGSRRC